jgi:hypothetical protein
LIRSLDIRRELKKLDVRSILEMFERFDCKNLHYIQTHDIRAYIEKAEADVPKYLDLVLKKEFKYELISFQ